MQPPKNFTGVPGYSNPPQPQPARIVDTTPGKPPREIQTPELTLYPNGNVRLNAAMARACKLHPRCAIDLEVPSRYVKDFYLDTRSSATRRLHFDIQEGSKFTCSRQLGHVFRHNSHERKLVFTLADSDDEQPPRYFKLRRLPAISRQNPPLAPSRREE